jgi:heterotetrameric sarcosine oxidase gamma subunit
VDERNAMQPAAISDKHSGIEAHGVAIAESLTSACWNVQGNPAREEFVTEFSRRFGTMALPVANTSARNEGWTALWLGPCSWLLLANPRLDAPTPDAFIATRDALNIHGGALFDVSASRVGFVIAGVHAATVLAKSCPLDLHPTVFVVGHCAQSVLGHINVLLYRPDSSTTFVVMVARSYAGDVWQALCASAAQYGCDVEAPVIFGENFAHGATV